MLFGAEVDLRWEHLILAAAVLAALGYGFKLLRQIAVGLQRWDSIPAMADDVARIRTEVVPPEGGIKLPPLHQRVAVLELAVKAIRDEMATSGELVSHTEQDAENFEHLNERLGEINEAVQESRPQPTEEPR